MTRTKAETSVWVLADRHAGPAAYTAFAQAAQSTGVIDWLLMPDQLTSWWPTSLWTGDNTPIAREVPDCDSWPDAALMAGYMSALAPDIGYVISTDGLRRGPAEMCQSMLTLADVTGGRAMFQIGAGELKQAKPFGHRRAEGLKRLEDLFRAWSHWSTHPDEPLSMDGNVWKLTNASLGTARHHLPQVWALGGGPKLIDLATTYADGFATMVPFAWPDAEAASRQIGAIKQALDAKGRDPEEFGFGVWLMALIHEDDAVIDQALDNPLLRWMTAAFGRVNQGDWLQEGIEPIFPADWHYAMKLLPVEWDAATAGEVVRKVTPQMGRKAWMCGTAEEVAAGAQALVEAGFNWVSVGDFLPIVIPPEDPAEVLANEAKVCSIIGKATRAPRASA
jgi:phthiodiolone/phenolphthiodiolone dimycocerosates ketoreductase